VKNKSTENIRGDIDPNDTSAAQLLYEVQARLILLIERTHHSTALEYLSEALKYTRTCFGCLEDDGNGPEFYKGMGT
jgi:hypothetical protein